MANEPDKAMAASVGSMTHFKKPIARKDQELLDRAVECFGDLDKALDWLQAPNAALKGLAPVRVAANPEGRQTVLDELGRIEYGVFA
jgi:putative toxin-antitoxin system antitoxin component (TIGR02293 family)